eukprot:g8811.t1
MSAAGRAFVCDERLIDIAKQLGREMLERWQREHRGRAMRTADEFGRFFDEFMPALSSRAKGEAKRRRLALLEKTRVPDGPALAIEESVGCDFDFPRVLPPEVLRIPMKTAMEFWWKALTKSAWWQEGVDLVAALVSRTARKDGRRAFVVADDNGIKLEYDYDNTRLGARTQARLTVPIGLSSQCFEFIDGVNIERTRMFFMSLEEWTRKNKDLAKGTGIEMFFHDGITGRDVIERMLVQEFAAKGYKVAEMYCTYANGHYGALKTRVLVSDACEKRMRGERETRPEPLSRVLGSWMITW